MENTLYYLESERLVFLTKEDARKYFFEEEVYDSAFISLTLNDFLIDEGYSCEEVFLLYPEEKADILATYHEEFFKRWVDEELIKCAIYE